MHTHSLNRIYIVFISIDLSGSTLFACCYSPGKCLDTPLILYSEEEETFGQNIYTMALLDQMGFKQEHGPASFRYPRIPHQWTIPEIIIKAEKLGAIDRGW